LNEISSSDLSLVQSITVHFKYNLYMSSNLSTQKRRVFIHQQILQTGHFFGRSYLSADMSKFESSQKYDCRTQSADSSKAYSKPLYMSMKRNFHFNLQQECAELLRELSPSASVQSSAEDREKKAKKLEDLKQQLEQVCDES